MDAVNLQEMQRKIGLAGGLTISGSLYKNWYTHQIYQRGIKAICK